MHTRFLSLLCILFSLQSILGQNTDPINYTVLSPESTAMGKYGFLPVSQYTGTPQIEVPLHTIDFEGLKIPIALSYHSGGGIRVSEESSWIGLGWSLSANAMITRSFSGYNDFGDITSDGYVNDDSIPDDVFANPAFETKLEDRNYFVDLKPDLFVVNLFGETIKFMLIKKSENSGKVGVFILDGNRKTILYDLSNHGFKIINDMGFAFIFNTKESALTYVGSSSNSESNCVPDTLVGNGVTAWYLDKIISPNGKELNFNYSSAVTLKSQINYVNSYSDIFCSNGFSTPLEFIGNKTSCSESHTTLKYLKNISYQDIDIDFELGTREDLTSTAPSTNTNVELMPKKLNKIDIKYKNKTVKKIDLTTSYFNSNKLNDQLKLKYVRLKLDKILINDLDEYSFTYHNSENLPSKSSKGVDFWGFYNGKDNNSYRYPDYEYFYPCPLNSTPVGASINGGDRNANFNYGKNGLLNKITYPTKGYSEFIYEPHVVKSSPNENAAIMDPDYNTYGISSNDESEGEITETIILTKNTDLKGNLTIFCMGSYNTGGVSVCDFNDSAIMSFGSRKAFEIIDASTGNSISSYTRPYSSYNGSSEPYTEQINMSLSAGTYYIKTKAINNPQYQLSDGRYFSFATVFSINIPIDADGINNSTYQNREIGGGRIKSIISYDSNQTPLLRRDYKYLEPNGNFSSGILINSLRFDNYFGVTPPTAYHGNSIGVEVSSVSNNISGSMFSLGSHIGYSMVEEITTNASSGSLNNGKKRTYYRNGKNTYYDFLAEGLYNTAITDENGTQFFGIVNNNFDNGSILSEEFFNGDDSIIKSISYGYFPYDLNPDFNRGGIAFVAYPPNTPLGILRNFLNFSYMSKINALKEKRIRDYIEEGDNTNFIETVIKYEYDNPNFLLTDEIVTNSDGKTFISKTYYPDDVTSTSSLVEILTNTEKVAIDGLKKENLHKINEPVQVDLYEDLDGDNIADPNELLNRRRTNYKDWGLNSTGTGNLILPELIQSSKGAIPLQDEIVFHSYYTNGNVKEASKKNGTAITYIWGYQQQYPIAKIENGTYAEISSQVSNLQTLSNNDDSVSDENTLRTALSNLRDTAALSDAMVTTYTYDPLVGVTSITDPKGYTTYYHYDNYGRLIYVKDHNGDLLSQNQYHYKSQQ